MVYKEWSTDNFWLPQTGLAILPYQNAIPTERPVIMKPYFDPENLKKLESTRHNKAKAGSQELRNQVNVAMMRVWDEEAGEGLERRLVLTWTRLVQLNGGIMDY